MTGSKLYLGMDAAYEARLRDSSNCDLATLHRLSQRAAFGVTMAERVGVDGDATVAALMRECGDHFAARVRADFVRRHPA